MKPTAARRRDDALAFIIEQIARYGICPSYGEIGRHLELSVTRIRQLVQQLVDEGAVERVPGAKRQFRVRDMAASRDMLGQALQRLGWVQAPAMGALQGGINDRPAMSTPFELVADPDDPEAF